MFKIAQPAMQYLLTQQAKFAAEAVRLEVFGEGKSIDAERARGMAASYAESARRYGAK